MWSFLYLVFALLVIWILLRILVWQVAKYVKAKFNVDVVVKSIRLLSAQEITIRINQLQTIEVDKISLKLFDSTSRHRINFHIKELRVRAEMKPADLSPVFGENISHTAKTHKRSASSARKQATLVNFVETFFKYASLHIDVLNVMVLNALVPDSLVHLNLTKIKLASETSAVSHELTSDCKLIGSLCVDSVDGKVLKSRKEASEVTSCIAEISTSLELVVGVERFFPSLVLTTVDANLSKLQLELHEGAIIPGIVLPRLKVKSLKGVDVSTDSDSARKLQLLVKKVVEILPTSSSLAIRSFGLAFFGDETMGETTRGAHVVADKVVLHQFKDKANPVSVKIGDDARSEFDIPSGYVRLQIDDVTMTDYYKRKVAEMGKTLLESKLNGNGVLSNSLDFTAWHADYKHKESILFWSIIFNKMHEAQRQQIVFGQTAAQLPVASRSHRESPQLTRRVRTFSAPEGASRHPAPDILEGTECSTFQESPPANGHTLTQLLRQAGVSVIFECTVYDASIDVVMTPRVATGDSSDFPPSFSIGLDSFTGIVDQSSQSGDFNFMSKLDRFWCMVEQDNDSIHFGSSDNKVGRYHPTIRSNIHDWGHVVTLDNLRLHGSASFKQPVSERADEVQEISLLVDAKVAGLQLELSKFAALALESFLKVVAGTNDPCDVTEGPVAGHKVLRRQVTSVEPRHQLRPESQRHIVLPPSNKFKLSCVEVELSRFNAFILSSDDMRCAECVVIRVDQFKTEINGANAMSDDEDASMSGSVSLAGIAVSTVHNPYFSAFASYEAGRSEGKRIETPITPSMRKRQTEVAQYTCLDAALMGSCRLRFDLLELNYSTKCELTDSFESPQQRNPPDYGRIPVKRPKCRRLVRQLGVTLQSEGKVTAAWSPSLHALVHYSIADIISTLTPYFERQPKEAIDPVTSQTGLFGDNGDHSAATSAPAATWSPINVSNCGDGASLAGQKPVVVYEMSLELAPIELRLDVAENQSVSFCFAALCCEQTEHLTTLKCADFAIVMDNNRIFGFSDNEIRLATWNEASNSERKKFKDLTTESNRCWSFNIDTLRIHFPYKYDFASTFDQTVTTWKWVKGLYRKTSHPFRTKKLPPDLVIDIGQFVFELADWRFECRLRDNHELMMDEWSESEKRRRVLDQRMAEMRRQRGEILPAKKVEELYCRLEEENTKIYLNRCMNLYGVEGPLVFDMPSPRRELRRFDTSGSCLFSWSMYGLKIAVLADDSMNGMRNAMNTIRTIDSVSPFPFKNFDGSDPEFVTLWCRCISVHATKHQVRLRNYPQCLMDYTDWKVTGKFAGAEHRGPPTAKRTEYVELPSPWGRAKVLRNMPALKFYYDLNSEVKTFNMAWGPCWDPAWSQVNLAFNLLSKLSIDPSVPLPWWDKSRNLLHGRLAFSMDRVNMLHLASLDPYNTTEHMHWDWKKLYMNWSPGCFLFKGDLDIHIRNASKYDDVRFLHLPQLKMECSFDWICLDGADPHDHHTVNPFAPDKIEGDLTEHDSYRYFRSRNIDLSITMDTRSGQSHKDFSPAEGETTDLPKKADRPEVLLYSTTLRWLSNFGTAINAVTRPICRGPIFGNKALPKLKLSRHYRNVKLSFAFPELKVSYWSSYAQQLGIEWLCGTGELDLLFRLTIVPYEGNLIRRSLGEWSITSTTCELKDTKMYLLKQKEAQEESTTDRRQTRERNFLLSLSQMSYSRDDVNGGRTRGQRSSAKGQESKSVPRTPSRGEFDDQRHRKYRRPKKPTSPTKRPQNSQNLIVHDLKAMWTTENRDIGYGLYEAYNKAAVLRRNLSTKILSKFRIGTDTVDDASDTSRRSSQMAPEEHHNTGLNQEGMDPRLMLRQLMADSDTRSVVGADEQAPEQQQLKGITACRMEDVVNQNWMIKFVNCQAMLKGPQTQGYIILTAAQADFLNREHRVMWRNGQLTTKSSWVGSLVGTQVFATVEKTIRSSGQEDVNVPWLSVSDIAPRGPSPGMLNISDLMGGGQAIGGVVGDGVSAGSYQLQRIMSRCTCRMYYVGYEALIDSEQTDYGGLLPETPADDDRGRSLGGKYARTGSDLLRNEKPVNMLTIQQSDLEICTNTSQFTMILDIVENLILYVEPVMRDFWERTDRMRFKLQLTSSDDAAKQRDMLASMQNRIRSRLTNMRMVERQLYRADRGLDLDQDNVDLREEANQLRCTLAEEKETLNEESVELGIIIRCFKEMFIEQKTRHSSMRPRHQTRDDVIKEQEEEEALVARTTEVAFGHVKWHLTDADGQLNIAQFEMKDFLYEKINKTDDTVGHCFELGSLTLLNLLPNSIYRDVIKLHHQMGLRSHGVSGAGGRSLTLRVLCRVRPPVGGISVKDHVEVNAAPLTIQLTYQFFMRMMKFFFPDKGVSSDDPDALESKSATLLGVGASSSGLERHGSLLSLPSRPPPPSPSTQQPTTPSGHRKNKSATKAIDDVDIMKKRAAENNTFLYIKITQVPLCVSYKGEKEKNIEDVHEFNLTIPMLEYHSVTWTWHDLAMAVKRDCKKQLVSQLIKEKLHLGGRSYNVSATLSSPEQDGASPAPEADKAKLLLGSSLQRTESQKRRFFRRKK